MKFQGDGDTWNPLKKFQRNVMMTAVPYINTLKKISISIKVNKIKQNTFPKEDFNKIYLAIGDYEYFIYK